MMTLAEVTSSFNTEQFRDTYGTATFYGQVQLYNESVRSGPAARRRIIEVAPDVVIPTKKTITELSTGQVFVLADGSADWFNGSAIAVKHPALPVGNTYSLRTVAQVLAGTVPADLIYAEPSYIRRVILEESSDYLGGYEMVYSPYFMPVPAGNVFYGDGKWFRCRENSRTDDLGLGVSEVVELIDPLQTLSYKSKTSTYDPATDTFTESAATNVQAFVIPIFLNYWNEVPGSQKHEDGDVSLSVLKSAITNLQPNEKVGDYFVLAVKGTSTLWQAHCRRHYA